MALCPAIRKTSLEDGAFQRSFEPNFSLQQIFEKSSKYAKDVLTCIVDIEKAYDRFPREKLWGVLRQ